VNTNPARYDVVCYWNGNGTYEIFEEEMECNNSTTDICTCHDSDREFFWGVGCVCRVGLYGMIGYTGCYECPDGGTSDPENNFAITDCYRQNFVWDDNRNAEVEKICQYSSSTKTYSDCTITRVVSCFDGSYLANMSDLSCTWVGMNYYSVYPLSRALCPTYTNASGGLSYGQGGSYAMAADECYIPKGEAFSDETGNWEYAYNCYYNQ
jgi:hypothetical protein